jgi:dihydroorotate dehydrogenase electron transfer subunit
VVANSGEAAVNRRLVLRVPEWPGFEPGQFVMLSPGARGGAIRSDPLLPRPMAVYRNAAYPNGDAGVEILYKVTGRGTALLADARPGDRVGVVGPLGHGFPLPPAGSTALLVGGGTGIASLYALAEAGARRARVVVCLGARSRHELMGGDDFARLEGVELRVATEDGSAGRRGLVTELLEEGLEECTGASPSPAHVYACGPTPMMDQAARLARKDAVSCFVSLENTMACGFGVCLGCAVPGRGPDFALVCRDGPVFEAHSVDWERLP